MNPGRKLNDRFRPIRKWVFLGIFFLFIIYSILVYTAGSDRGPHVLLKDAEASSGKLVWQKYNCQSCHQLYGLGGYLGPDLTDLYSRLEHPDQWLRAMLASGPGAMPVFQIPESEIVQLGNFLRAIDSSGNFPERDPRINWWGSFDLDK